MGKAGEVIFNTEEIARVDERVVADLKRRALADPSGRVRLCLHRSLDEGVQEMILVQREGAYVRPHMHAQEAESFHVIEGAMRVVLFDAGGRPQQHFRMAQKGSGDCFFCRIDKGRWHTMLPLTDPVVFLETTQGPFRGEAHSTFAEWAPVEDDAEAVAAFLAGLRGR